MLKYGVAALGLGALAVAGTAGAQAQASAEATRWIVPVPAPRMTLASEGASIVAINLGGQNAQVTVMAYSEDGTATRVEQVKALAPGRSAYFKSDRLPAYYLVISDVPVVAEAMAYVNTPASDAPFAQMRQMQGYLGLGRESQGGIYAEGVIRTWGPRQVVTLDAQPIDCATAAAGNFACAQRLPVNGPATGLTAPRAGQAAQPDPPPRLPEGRTTQTPGVIPGDAPRLTQTPSPRPQ